MKYIKLGESELKVSRVCMGCMGFGDPVKGMHSWTLGEEQSRAIIKHGLEVGINFFDTAAVYQGGTSEIYLGKALKSLAMRDDVVIATKFTPRTDEEIAAGISGQEHIAKILDNSLKNLGTDYVDLYIYHMWDFRTPLYDIMDGLNRAVKEGKARYIGISNCFAWQLAQANALAEKEGFASFVSVQGHYNLLNREEEREMIPFCKQENIAITPYSALAGGRLSRMPNEDSNRLRLDNYAKSKYDQTADKDARIIERVHELALSHGCTMTEIALSWLLGRADSPVVGATKVSHVEDAARAVELVLADDEYNYLEELYEPHALVGVMAENLCILKGKR